MCPCAGEHGRSPPPPASPNLISKGLDQAVEKVQASELSFGASFSLFGPGSSRHIFFFIKLKTGFHVIHMDDREIDFNRRVTVKDPPASASQELELEACTTTPIAWLFIVKNQGCWLLVPLV